MKSIGTVAIRYPFGIRSSTANTLFFATLVIIMMLTLTVHAETATMPMDKRISLERVFPGANGGFGYVLEYYVPAPIEAVWRFKTNFDSEVLLTSDELVGHRLVSSVGNSVITENRYATAPGLTFLWRTTMIPDEFRLTFKLLNPEECRHDFHHGSIQLSPAGDHTRITQIAYFNFRGASLWVKYPWYGGMKSTLTKVAKWEQKLAYQYKRQYLAALGN
jgi:hypothetical protein